LENFSAFEMILFMVILLFSLTVHEWAHAISAHFLGDDTALEEGRMTLNPSSHIDPVGTIIFPLIGFYSGFLFGWAKPVPVNPLRFSKKYSQKAGMMITAAAGPVSNLLIAIFAVLFFRNFWGSDYGKELLTGSLAEYKGLIAPMFKFTFSLNVILFVFNLIPLPPLDGSRVLEGLLPADKLEAYKSISQYSFFILLGIIFVAPQIISMPTYWVSKFILKTFTI